MGSDVKRWSIATDFCDANGCGAEMERDDVGGFVQHADHAAALAERDEEIDQLETGANMLRAEEAQMIGDLRTKLDEARGQKDGAYGERNKLVAALSKLLPAWLERHPAEDESWEDDWRWIVFVLPASGFQMSWHIHDSELPMFDHLPRHKNQNSWDGHTTAEKYERLRFLSADDERG